MQLWEKEEVSILEKPRPATTTIELHKGEVIGHRALLRWCVTRCSGTGDVPTTR